jgi:hypothetical protein
MRAAVSASIPAARAHFIALCRVDPGLPPWRLPGLSAHSPAATVDSLTALELMQII